MAHKNTTSMLFNSDLDANLYLNYKEGVMRLSLGNIILEYNENKQLNKPEVYFKEQLEAHKKYLGFLENERRSVQSQSNEVVDIEHEWGKYLQYSSFPEIVKIQAKLSARLEFFGKYSLRELTKEENKFFQNYESTNLFLKEFILSKKDFFEENLDLDFRKETIQDLENLVKTSEGISSNHYLISRAWQNILNSNNRFLEMMYDN